MKILRIAVGSQRKPKLDAVQKAASAIAPLFSELVSLEVVGYGVESGVSHTPTSREELMRGARRRAELLQDKLCSAGSPADFYVGLEGGLNVVTDSDESRVFLESWAHVSDGVHGHLGCGGSIELPEALAAEVLSRGVELSTAIDRYAGQAGIRDGQGAWGILSAQLISRQESFRLAVLTAFAPFYNARMYRAPTSASR